MQLQRASNKRPLRIGRELGRGGEGAVFAIENSPSLVAKIYLRAPTAAKSEKLRSMVRRATAQLLRVAAWPMDLLLDDKGAVVGFLMRKVAAREDIHELYSPRSRRQKFSTVNFRFVVRVATNLSRAFAQVHALGNVIGDVNHGNALVGRDGTVVLIDCDSIQTRDGSRIHTCDVGVPLFTPPELQGRPFRALRRSAEHDAFGLAVLIFHLLYLGRHPFAGRYREGEMPIERAIAESRFVYGARAAELGMAAPPGTLPLGAFGPRIAALLERSFAPPGEATRASATEWVEALQELELGLVSCADSKLHFHPGDAPCCWCEIESASGMKFFGAEIPDVNSPEALKLDQLWEAISAVPAPDPSPPARTPRVLVKFPPVRALVAHPTSPISKRTIIVVSWALVALALLGMLSYPGNFWLIATGLVIFATALRMWNYFTSSEVKKDKDELSEMRRAEIRWKNLIEVWSRECTDESFKRATNQLVMARVQLLELSARRDSELRHLRDRREDEQRATWLGLYRIDGANLSGISQEEMALLAEHHVHTAADVLRLPDKFDTEPKLRRGFSRGSEVMLRAWAAAHAAAFSRVSVGPPKPDDIRRIDDSIATQRDLLLATLRSGPEMLKARHDEILAARAKWGPQLDSAWADLDVARDRARFAIQD